MVQGEAIASFGCDSFHLIGTCLFLVFNQNFKLKDVLAKEKRFDIFVFYMIQPRVIDLLFSCYSFKTLKY